ncbi:hypothetical protein QBC39DRAFT_374188 [Podospora conica]|nr:hypothetical protein QBC39DRAFT_374188 [Schizothecium conicum]
MDAAAATESKGQGVGDSRRKSSTVSPRTTRPTSMISSGPGSSDCVLPPTPPETKETTTTPEDLSPAAARRQSSSVGSSASQHPNWRLPLPPDQEQARRQSLSYTHQHPPRRPSSLTLLQQRPLDDQDPQDPATIPYRPPPARQPSVSQQQQQEEEDPHAYRPPLHVLTTPMSPWPGAAFGYPPPYAFAPGGPTPTPYPSISLPTLHPAPSPLLHFQHPSPLHLTSPLHHLPTSPYPLTATPLSPAPLPFPSTPGASDLQTQQSYLLQALQKEHERASRLVARYNALIAAGDQGRKARKEVASLKVRIEEAGRQERMVVLRLGEVWCEGRERGRWGGQGMGGGFDGGRGRVGSIGEVMGGGSGGGGGAVRRDSARASVSDERRKSTAVLSPLVPEFVPGAGAAARAAGKKSSVASGGSGRQRTGGVVFADDIWGGGGEGGGRKGSEEGGKGPTSLCGGDEGGGEKAVEDLRWEFDSDGGSGKDEGDAGEGSGEGSDKKTAHHHRRVSMHHAPPFLFKAARDKRMSLPSVKTLWLRSHTVPEVDGSADEEDGGFI